MVKQLGSFQRCKAPGLSHDRLSFEVEIVAFYCFTGYLCEIRSSKDVLTEEEPNSTAGWLGW